MKDYRFTLKPYRTPADRLECPHCHQWHCFSPYIDTEGMIAFPAYVGRCNHEHRCGYHYTPRDYFHDHPEAKAELLAKDAAPIPRPCHSARQHLAAEPYYFSMELVAQTEGHYQRNNLYLFLEERLGTEAALQLTKKYHAGTSRYWDGATVFWQVDAAQRARTGKIMYYDVVTGHRAQDAEHHVTWLHSLRHIDKEWITQYFFGEHLLGKSDKPVAIVESEKSCLIASFYIPQFTWIATGGKDGMFSKANLSLFKDRKVILFPDLGQYDNCLRKAAELKVRGIDASCYSYLEDHATEEERKAGLDIADYLLTEDPRKGVLRDMIRRNPAIGLLVEKLQLEIVDE